MQPKQHRFEDVIYNTLCSGLHDITTEGITHGPRTWILFIGPGYLLNLKSPKPTIDISWRIWAVKNRPNMCYPAGPGEGSSPPE